MDTGGVRDGGKLASTDSPGVSGGGGSRVPSGACDVAVVMLSGECACTVKDVNFETMIGIIRERVAETTSVDISQIRLCSGSDRVLNDNDTISAALEDHDTKGGVTLKLIVRRPRLVLGEPAKLVARALQLTASWVEEVQPHLVREEPGIERLSGVITLFLPPNGYQGSRAPWSVDDVEEWLLLLPRPHTVQGDLLAAFRLRDGRHVYVRALSDYYSGDWAGINLRVYVALDLESLETYGMGFNIARIEEGVFEEPEAKRSPGQLSLKAWEAVAHAVGDVKRWLVCNDDAHSSRRGNVPSTVRERASSACSSSS